MHLRQWGLGIAGVLLGLASACAEQRVESSTPIAPSPSPEAFANPTAGGTPESILAVPALPPAAPNLIPPTTATARLPEVNVGRGDPFTSVSNPPIVSIAPTAPQSPASLSAALPPDPAPTMPATVSTVPLAPALPVLTPANGDPTPVAVPATPASRSINEIQVSGVVQIGDKLSAIVEISGENSRYVTVGDRLGNGAFVRRIEMTGSNPRVVFERDGVEFARTVL